MFKIIIKKIYSLCLCCYSTIRIIWFTADWRAVCPWLAQKTRVYGKSFVLKTSGLGSHPLFMEDMACIIINLYHFIEGWLPNQLVYNRIAVFIYTHTLYETVPSFCYCGKNLFFQVRLRSFSLYIWVWDVVNIWPAIELRLGLCTILLD